MNKVYLLLRNNRQTGPYNLEELLQLHLKPFDLVWVEGRSAAWRYPGEIEVLKDYVAAPPQPEVPFQPIATAAMEQGAPGKEPVTLPGPQSPSPYRTPGVPKNVFVSRPGQQQEMPRRATTETPRPVPPEYTAPPSPPLEEPASTLTSHYNRPIEEMEEAYTSFVYNQSLKKKPSVSKRDLVVAALLVVFIGAGYWLLSRPSVLASQPVTQKEVIPVKEVEDPVAGATEKDPVLPTVTVEATSGVTSKASVNNKNKTRTPPQTRQQQRISIPPAATSKAEEEYAVMAENHNNEAVKAAPAKPEKQEKKKVKDRIRDLFAKKDKKEETVAAPVKVEEPRPAENRQAARRNAEESPASEKEEQTTALTSLIDITSNAPENWMMGVRNLKVTLRNRSSVTIQTAAVQVLYYNENNELVDRKLVYFNNVPPKGKLTQPAPDHKFADHVDFKLGAVSAKEDRYARE